MSALWRDAQVAGAGLGPRQCHEDDGRLGLWHLHRLGRRAARGRRRGFEQLRAPRRLQSMEEGRRRA